MHLVRYFILSKFGSVQFISFDVIVYFVVCDLESILRLVTYSLISLLPHLLCSVIAVLLAYYFGYYLKPLILLSFPLRGLVTVQ